MRERARDAYARRFGAAQIEVKQGSTAMWRVLVGRESSFAAAQQLANALAAEETTRIRGASRRDAASPPRRWFQIRRGFP